MRQLTIESTGSIITSVSRTNPQQRRKGKHTTMATTNAFKSAHVAPATVSQKRAPRAHSGTSIIAQFLQYTPAGQVDLRKTVKVFEDFVRAQLKAQEDIKPTIIEELRNYGRVGEMTLVTFALHALKLP